MSREDSDLRAILDPQQAAQHVICSPVVFQCRRRSRDEPASMLGELAFIKWIVGESAAGSPIDAISPREEPFVDEVAP